MNSNLQDDPDEPKGDPPRTERGPARRRGFAYRVISWVVASLMVLAFWLAIRPQTWEALFPDYRRARANRTQEIPPPSLQESTLAPNPRPSPVELRPGTGASPPAGAASMAEDARPAEPDESDTWGRGIRGRIVFEGPVPTGLRLEVHRAASGHRSEPTDTKPLAAPLTADGYFVQPLESWSKVRLRVIWDGGDATFGPVFTRGLEEGQRIELRLGTCTLEGQILDIEGNPEGGVEVVDEAAATELGGIAQFRETKSSAAGFWRLEDLPAGTHHYWSERTGPPGSGWAVRRGTFELAPAERRRLDLGDSPTDVTWTGRMKLRTGAKFPRAAYLRMRRDGGRFVTEASCDDAGRFRLVAAAGLYDLECNVGHFELDARLQPTRFPPLLPEQVVLERDVEADIVVVAGWISGRVVEPPLGRRDRRLRLLGCRPLPLVAYGRRGGRSGVQLSPEGGFGPVLLHPGRYQLELIELSGKDYSTTCHWPLLDSQGIPAVVDVVDGGETTGLELRVAGQ